MKTIALPTKTKLTTLLISLLTSLALLVLLQGNTSAATINVASGTDTIASDSTCHLSEAIQNINDQAQTNADCPAGDGNDDTITLPTGTITLSADLPQLTESITIQGQGMGQSIIDGDGQYMVLRTALAPLEADLYVYNLTITGFSEAAIACSINYAHIENVEINGNGAIKNDTLFGPGTNLLLGIFLVGAGTGEDNADINNVYVHDLNASDTSAIRGIGTYGVNNTISNSTVSNMSSTSDVSVAAVIVGPNLPNFPGGTATSEITNVTVDTISGNNTEGVIGIGTEVYAASQDSTLTTSITNTTVNNLSATGTNEIFSSFLVQSIALTGTIDAINNITFKNNIFSNSSGSNCLYRDITSSQGGTGTPVLSTTSNGGNISDTSGCSSWFNNATDSNNNSSINSTLGTLANYGGSVPTLKLLPGSPAIDNVSCTGAPSTDARGVARPQGTSCDSGAYEVSQANKTTTSSTSKPVKLNAPKGVVVNSFSALNSTEVAEDNAGNAEYEYPLGLTSFELGVPNGSTQEISLEFETELSPEEVVVRKYDSTDQTYTDLEGAVVESSTVNDNPGIRVTYSITDGQFPDTDGQVNGEIVDPIGLAVEKKGVLANTGDGMIITSIFVGIFMVVVALYTYIDYRKHKGPLSEVDIDLAQHYTYWHHIKVVTLPLFTYRLSFAFEKAETQRINGIN